jgi:hypothetical protein
MIEREKERRREGKKERKRRRSALHCHPAIRH